MDAAEHESGEKTRLKEFYVCFMFGCCLCCQCSISAGNILFLTSYIPPLGQPAGAASSIWAVGFKFPVLPCQSFICLSCPIPLLVAVVWSSMCLCDSLNPCRHTTERSAGHDVYTVTSLFTSSPHDHSKMPTKFKVSLMTRACQAHMHTCAHMTHTCTLPPTCFFPEEPWDFLPASNILSTPGWARVFGN